MVLSFISVKAHSAASGRLEEAWDKSEKFYQKEYPDKIYNPAVLLQEEEFTKNQQ